MVDTAELRRRMGNSGMTMSFIARKSHIKRETLYKKLASGDFTVTEALHLSETLRFKISERNSIFFAKQGESDSHIED